MADESAQARVTFYTRAGCHLCEQALAVVAEVCRDVGERYVEVDIDGPTAAATVAPDVLRRMSDEVPVTYVDGRQHDFWRVDPQRLRAALASPAVD